MFTTANIITLVAVVTLLITASAIVGGSFRISRNTATVSRYKEAAESWEAKSRAQDERMEAQDDKINTLQQLIAAKDHTISELEGRLAVLQEMVTGKSALEALTTSVDGFLRKWEVRSTSWIDRIDAIHGDTKAIHEKLDAMTARLEADDHGKR